MVRRTAVLALLACLTGCARPEGAPEPRYSLSFEDRAEPEVFAREAPAVRDREGGAAGLWAAVRGLPRPERALVVNLGTGAEVAVALFRASADPVRLSNEAADALGIGAAPVRVRITALRQEVKLDTTTGRF
jgi:hypothetical protein